ncbi:MAG: hypothetical protein R6X32_06050 [Chloroflexota bacterium]
MEITKVEIGEHIIGIQEVEGQMLYLPLMDNDEHKHYFCWSLEAALITRLYYMRHQTINDMFLINIMHELGIKDNQPGTTYNWPSTRLAVLATVDGRTVEISRTFGRQ